MKLYQRFLVASFALTLGVVGGVQSSHAQIWSQYNVQIVNQFYNPLAGSSLIPDNTFLSFSGSSDKDDGVANGIPTGAPPLNPFVFDYNGNLYNSVNVCVNGWVSVGNQATPITPNNPNNLFTSTQPNNTVAPYFGDHFYRTLEPGYRPSKISYLTTSVADPNPNTPPGSRIHTFVVEWKDLNINDKTNPNSFASFQVKFIENPMANDLAVPDKRVTIEFHYGPIGGSGTVLTVGAAVGIEDSIGANHINALFTSAIAGGDSARLNTTKRSDCWPPATCLPGRVIQFVPQGRLSLNQWGDGDVNLTQVNDTSNRVRTNQNRFVTLADADIVLQSRTMFPPLDSTEGRAAFHGDANHTGRFQNLLISPTAYFYRVTAYDAAYILMYLAAKLPVLPWPDPLPVPGYKESDVTTTNISGIAVDGGNATLIANTIRVPVVLRGVVNGPIGVELNAKSSDGSLQLIGTKSANNSLVRMNVAEGKVVIAASGIYKDGDVLGYLEFAGNANANTEIAIANVVANDEAMPATKTNLRLADVGSTNGGSFHMEQNTPNPFLMTGSNRTAIGFDLGTTESVALRVYDMLGHEVRTLVANEVRSIGHNSVEWDGRDNAGNLVSSGLFYYQIATPSFTQTVKMQVIR